MQKIVVNKCYGGFSLSPKAALKIYELGGTVMKYPIDEYYSSDSDKLNEDQENWKKYLETGKTSWFLTIFSPDGKYVISEREIDRDDPILVQVVEELGNEANGDCAKLRVVEIPDGVEWIIEEYDGLEHIAESHRTW
jgi:hypothetical protein